jgi:peptidoglycan/LPS O-acetylase OafA/YrhL
MPPSDPAGKRERLPVIDVLRLCAALGVLVFHVSAFAGMAKRVMPPIRLFGHLVDKVPSVFTFGATGVSLFFVISGFCLFLSARRAPQSLSAYVANRAARIYPNYLFALALSAGVAFWLNGRWDGWDVVVKALFLHGFVQAYNLSLNGALWSMATEVQFYAAFPLLAWAMKRWGPWPCVLAALSVCLVFRAVVDHLPGAQVVAGGVARGAFLSNLLPGRLVEFVAGMAAASLYLDRPQALRKGAAYAVLPLMALAIVARGAGPNWLAEPALGLGYAALLAAAITGGAAAVSAASPLAVMGRASYALFLIHIPIFLIVARVVDFGGLGPYARLAAMLAVGLPVCGLAALAIYGWLELPAWRRLSRRAPRPGLATA